MLNARYSRLTGVHLDRSRPPAAVPAATSGALVACVVALALGGAAEAAAPVLAPAPAPRPADVPPPPPATLAMMSKARISGVTGWLVRDLDTGAVIDAHLPARAFVPASVAKLPTAAYALDRLGAQHRFETRLLARGTLAGRVLTGDLVLEGGGDPELDTDGLVSLAEQARSLVDRATGGVIADPGPLARLNAIEPNQPPDASYNPGVGGLALNFNRVRVEWPRGGNPISVRAQALVNRPVTTAVTVTPVRGLPVGLTPRAEAVARGIVAGPATPAAASATPQDAVEDWLINERVLRRAGGRWLPVRDTARYAGGVMVDMLATKGVGLGDGVRVEPGSALAPNTAVVARRFSRPLDRVLRGMLRHSTNITAEMVGLAASGAAPKGGLAAVTAPGSLRNVARNPGGGITMTLDRGGRTDPAGLAVSATRMNAWAAQQGGFLAGSTGFRLANHSGLSVASRLSPDRMVDLLMGLDPVDACAAPVVWLKTRCPGAPGVAALLKPHHVAFDGDGLDHANLRVVAKTGTMSFVRGLAGYVHTPGGRRLAFAVFSNDLPRRETDRRGSRTWTARARNLERRLIGEWVRMADAPVAPATPVSPGR